MKPAVYLFSLFLYRALVCPLSAVAMGIDDPITDDASPSVHQLSLTGQQSCASSHSLPEKTTQSIMSNPEGTNNVDVSVELGLLKQERSGWKLNESQEIDAQNLFKELKQRNITIKKTFYPLLAKADQGNFSSVCHKVGVFFRYVKPGVIKNSGCLTGMVKNKKQLQNFIARDDKSIQYIAGLDTLRAFSSMHSYKGLPAEKPVRDLLDLDAWQVNGKFDHTLFHAFSSMHHGKGLPAKQAVEDFLALDVWQVDGRFSTGLFRAFSSMQSGKGLPAEKSVRDLLGWLQHGALVIDVNLKLMARLYTGKGIPSLQMLKIFEQKSENLFPINAVTEDDEDKKEEHCERIKYLALHLTVKDKGTALNWEKVSQFKEEVGEHDPLKELVKILATYGSNGVDVFLTMDEQKRASFLTFCALGISLQLVQKTFNEVH